MKEPNVRYQNQGNYQLPCIATKEQTELHIGVWANRHRQHLKQHHRIKYYNLLTSERLYHYLADIEEQAEAIWFAILIILSIDCHLVFKVPEMTGCHLRLRIYFLYSFIRAS